MLSLVYMPAGEILLHDPMALETFYPFPLQASISGFLVPRGEAHPPFFNKQKAPLTAQDAARGGLRDGFSPTN